MTLLAYSQRTARSAYLVYGSARNIFLIAKQREAAVPPEPERVVWADLMTRSQWCYRFIERALYPLLNQIIDLLGAPAQPGLKQLRLAYPISFNAEPCRLCKTLEKSFSPNDQQLRTTTVPFWDQYYECYESLVANAYAIMGAGNYYYNLITSIRDTLTDPVYEKPLKLWDYGIKASEDFLAYGRNCFSRTEAARKIERQDLRNRKSRVAPLEVAVNQKYFVVNAKALSAVTGLYALNTELLCKDCKAAVEARPLNWED